MTDTRLHRIWSDMVSRCRNPRCLCYHRYGGRGISVCGEWSSYEAFAEWAHNSGYDSALTIDRMDNDGNYCPENCRWATRRQQARNRRDNRKVVLGGREMTVEEASEVSGVSSPTLRGRMRRGMTIERAVGPVRKRSYGVVIGGEYRTFKELTRQAGLPPKTISARVKRGWTGDRLTAPKTPTGTGTARWVEFRGERHYVTEWAKLLGIPLSALSKRLQYGWSVERVFTTPVRVLKGVRHG